MDDWTAIRLLVLCSLLSGFALGWAFCRLFGKVAGVKRDE